MALDETEFADRLDRFLDGLAEGTDRSPNGQPTPDHELAPTVRRLRAYDDAPTADPHFADRLLEDLMHTATPREFSALHLTPTLTQAPATSAGSGAPRWFSTTRPRWALAQLATAALLLLTLIASVLAFGPTRPGRHDTPVFLAAVGTPEPTSPVAFVWQTKGGPDLPLNQPINPVLDPQGNLWVAVSRNSRFQIFAPDGTFLEAWGTFGSGEGQFDFVDPVTAGGSGHAAAAFDAAGNLYVADPGNHRIQKFGPDRAFITAWGSAGKEDGQFVALLGLAVDGQGRVYTSDEERDVVQVFDDAGRLLAVWGGADAGEGWLPSPAALTIAPDGTLWITNFRQDRVQQYSPDGQLLATWGQTGTDTGEFKNPSDVAVDAHGRVYVTEYSNNRVQVFDSEGQFLTSWGTLGFDAGKFYTPNSLVLDGAGNVYVAEDNDRIQKFRLLPPLAPE